MTNTTPGFGAIHLANLSADPGGPLLSRYRVVAACLTLKSESGRIQHAYEGATLDWLHPEQQFLLECGELVEIYEPTSLSEPDQEVSSPPDACGAALDGLGIHPSCGAPAARTALRNGGYRFGNDVIAAAVKARKSVHELSRTAGEAV